MKEISEEDFEDENKVEEDGIEHVAGYLSRHFRRDHPWMGKCTYE